MRHDFKRTDSKGRNCYGYMDYEDSTNYWSTCSVEDFMGTKKDCLRAANNRDDDDSRNDNSNGNGKIFDFQTIFYPEIMIFLSPIETEILIL